MITRPGWPGDGLLSNDATVTLILTLPVVTATVVTAAVRWLDARARRQDRHEEWARQDLLEERARLRDEKINTLVDETAGQTETLASIAGQVDGAYTAQMLDNLDNLEIGLHALREVVALRRDAGKQSPAATLAAIVAIETKIETLRSTVAHRMELNGTPSPMED